MPEIVSFAPERIKMVSHIAAELTTGKLVTLIAGMITLVNAVGTIPLHQFAPLFQSVLTEPSQVPGRHVVVFTFKTPVAVVPK